MVNVGRYTSHMDPMENGWYNLLLRENEFRKWIFLFLNCPGGYF